MMALASVRMAPCWKLIMCCRYIRMIDRCPSYGREHQHSNQQKSRNFGRYFHYLIEILLCTSVPDSLRSRKLHSYFFRQALADLRW